MIKMSLQRNLFQGLERNYCHMSVTVKSPTTKDILYICIYSNHVGSLAWYIVSQHGAKNAADDFVSFLLRTIGRIYTVANVYL